MTTDDPDTKPPTELCRRERALALRALAGHLSHELRNPLAAVHAACHSLAGEVADPDHQRRLGLVIGEVERMVGVLGDTVRGLELPPAEPVPTDIGAALRSAVDALARPDITLDGPPDLRWPLPPKALALSAYSLLQELPGTLGLSWQETPEALLIRVCAAELPEPGAASPGLLVARRFVREQAGRLTLAADPGDTPCLCLELPRRHD